MSVQAQEAAEEKEDGEKALPEGIAESGPAAEVESQQVEEQTEESSHEEKIKEKKAELNFFMKNLEKTVVKKCQKFAVAERKITLDMSISSSGHVEHLETSGSLSLDELNCVQYVISNLLFPSAEYNYKIKYTMTMPSSEVSSAGTGPVSLKQKVEPAEPAAQEPVHPGETGWPAYATRGNVELGGGLEFYFQRSSFEPEGDDSSETESDSYRLAFTPFVSYFITNIFAFGVGTKIIFDKIADANNFSFLFFISPALVAKLGPTAFFFFDVVLGAAARSVDILEDDETTTVTGGLFHIGALFGLAVSISRNLVIKTGPAVSYEIGTVSDGEDFKAQNILAGFYMGFSFYIPTKRSFREAGKRLQNVNP